MFRALLLTSGLTAAVSLGTATNSGLRLTGPTYQIPAAQYPWVAPSQVLFLLAILLITSVLTARRENACGISPLVLHCLRNFLAAIPLTVVAVFVIFIPVALLSFALQHGLGVQEPAGAVICAAVLVPLAMAFAFAAGRYYRVDSVSEAGQADATSQ
ncbi:hypothetical protein ACFL59_03810 [Planctomycetota bacterium]